MDMEEVLVGDMGNVGGSKWLWRIMDVFFREGVKMCFDWNGVV